MNRLTEKRKVIEILDKMNFFQGQRAGRELWNDKPKNVQEEDLDKFNADIRTIRDYIWDLEQELKQYKDAEEQGLLLRLPCKVGDTVYAFGLPNRNRFYEVIVTRIEIYQKSIWLNFSDGLWDRKIDDIGKTIFLTKEEAEAKLKEMESE